MEMKNANEHIISSGCEGYCFGLDSVIVYTLYLKEKDETDFYVEEEKIKETLSKIFDVKNLHISFIVNKHNILSNDLIDFTKTFGIDVDKKVTEILIFVEGEQIEDKLNNILKDLGIKEEEFKYYLNDLVMKYVSIKKD
jgi:LPS O-antigen subunit length determinant protein (WzzB/FepE family)